MINPVEEFRAAAEGYVNCRIDLLQKGRVQHEAMKAVSEARSAVDKAEADLAKFVGPNLRQRCVRLGNGSTLVVRYLDRKPGAETNAVQVDSFNANGELVG